MNRPTASHAMKRALILASLLFVGSVQGQQADQPLSLEDVVGTGTPDWAQVHMFRYFNRCMPFYFYGAELGGLSPEDLERVDDTVRDLLPVVDYDGSDIFRPVLWLSGEPVSSPTPSYSIEFSFSKRLYDPISETYMYMTTYERVGTIPSISTDDIVAAVSSAASAFMEDYLAVNHEQDCAELDGELHD